MALAAAQVVDAVAARLVPMAATAGRVYTSRLWPLAEADLPAWRVIAQDETVEMLTTADTEQQHELTIDAACYDRTTADLDDVLHGHAAAGLALLFAPPAPHHLRLVNILRDLATEGEASMGRITLRMAATYITAPSAPETIL